MPDRTYLDWNATAPLRPEARAAMIAAMDVVGNPSSVHTEGRAAKMMIEKAREQVAALVGCDSTEVVFTSGATEGAATVLSKSDEIFALPVEHDCVYKWANSTGDVDEDGLSSVLFDTKHPDMNGIVCWQRANSETGVVQVLPPWMQNAHTLVDIVQSVGRYDENSHGMGFSYGLTSAHKLGGAKGAGALILHQGAGFEETPPGGGGQEKGRRSGTENVIGIAGFGAAAEAAQRDLDAGAWEPIADLRDDLESALRDCAGDDLTIFGEGAPRLPNTSCFAIPGWKGETQVMQLDLAGFAVSAGSACSSGKVGPSRVLKAMGYDDNTASSAIRVSMGTTTTKDEVSRFIDAWTALYQRMKTRAA